MCTGDVNLMNVTDPRSPFARVGDTQSGRRALRQSRMLPLRTGRRSLSDEGFYARPQVAEALRIAGFHAVGTANNVNYGAAAILVVLARAPRRVGIAAHRRRTQPRGGTRTRQSSAATACGSASCSARRSTGRPITKPGRHSRRRRLARPHRLPGAMRTRRAANSADEPARRAADKWSPGPTRRTSQTPARRIGALRQKADIVVASYHWGLEREVLQYMTEIAHAAIDAGADIVIGHGPHYSLPVEVYKGRPIFYGLGSFSFHTGHGGRKHGDWVGMLARVGHRRRRDTEAAFRLARHNDANGTDSPIRARKRSRSRKSAAAASPSTPSSRSSARKCAYTAGEATSGSC